MVSSIASFTNDGDDIRQLNVTNVDIMARDASDEVKPYHLPVFLLGKASDWLTAELHRFECTPELEVDPFYHRSFDTFMRWIYTGQISWGGAETGREPILAYKLCCIASQWRLPSLHDQALRKLEGLSDLMNYGFELSDDDDIEQLTITPTDALRRDLPCVERTEHFNLLMQACYNEDYEDIREQRVKDIHEALEMFMTENKGKIPSKDKSELVPVERYRLA